MLVAVQADLPLTPLSQATLVWKVCALTKSVLLSSKPVQPSQSRWTGVPQVARWCLGLAMFFGLLAKIMTREHDKLNKSVKDIASALDNTMDADARHLHEPSCIINHCQLVVCVCIIESECTGHWGIYYRLLDSPSSFTIYICHCPRNRLQALRPSKLSKSLGGTFFGSGQLLNISSIRFPFHYHDASAVLLSHLFSKH
jgi:hypothetical protein